MDVNAVATFAGVGLSTRLPLVTTCGSKGGFRSQPKQNKPTRIRTKNSQTNKKEEEVKEGRRIGFGGEDATWRCAPNCGACCKLEKGPNYPTPQEIFPDDPDLAKLVESMVGSDGWCKHYSHADRTCSIYDDRPFFCRAEPEVFSRLFGIDEKSFNSEACRACRDSIKSVYGLDSQELKNFNSTVASSKTRRWLLLAFS